MAFPIVEGGGGGGGEYDIIESVKSLFRHKASIHCADGYFTNTIFHLSYDNACRRRQRKRSLLLSSHYIIAPRAIYFMLHTQLLCFDFIKSNQEKFISFYRFAIEHDSNKTFSFRRKASDGGDKNTKFGFLLCFRVVSTSDFSCASFSGDTRRWMSAR